jgi:hypothetical protein
MCNKKRFGLGGALRALRFSRRSRNPRRRECRYYWCRYCNSYHLTSQPRG